MSEVKDGQRLISKFPEAYGNATVVVIYNTIKDDLTSVYIVPDSPLEEEKSMFVEDLVKHYTLSDKCVDKGRFFRAMLNKAVSGCSRYSEKDIVESLKEMAEYMGKFA